jgi:hypothetical protein
VRESERNLLGTYWIWPHEVEDKSISGRKALIAKLESACRADRARALACRWDYSMARHNALLRILMRERAALAAIETSKGEGVASNASN